VLEVNCHCALEDGMGLARSAARAGIPYPQLLRRIVKIAMETSPSFGVGISML